MHETRATEIQRMDLYQLIRLAGAEETVALWRRGLFEEQFLLPLAGPAIRAARRAG